jgi:hypothetical protein
MNAYYYEYFNTYTILYGYYCHNCDKAEIEPSGYCKICGEEAFLFDRSCHRTFYDGIEVNEDKRVIYCPVCDNEIFSDHADFCKICSTPVYNVCEGEPITDIFGDVTGYTYHINDGNARYCTKCGKKTVFYTEGFLEDWKS